MDVVRSGFELAVDSRGVGTAEIMGLVGDGRVELDARDAVAEGAVEEGVVSLASF